MTRISIILLLLVSLAHLLASTNGAPTATPTKYIITLKPTVNQHLFTRSLHAELAASAESASLNRIHDEYSIADHFKAYTGTFSPSIIAKLRQHSAVEAIEPDGIVHAFGTGGSKRQDNPLSWGLARVSQRENPKYPGAYVYPAHGGDGVDVYVIDTGIMANHTDFEGRASHAWSAVKSWPETDDNGHGTHVASTIAGRLHGLAKRSRLHGVKVLSATGSGSIFGVLGGIRFVADQAQRQGNKTVIANMSLGGAFNFAVNRAVAAAARVGVMFAFAAGNEAGDACDVSLASSPYGVTVAAGVRNETVAWFSNWGRCVDVIAPGFNITAAYIDGGVETWSGTSMASPHVAGALALILANDPMQTPEQVKAKLLSATTNGTIQGDLRETPNRVLYVQPE
ncbi:peptidase S8/S53 domain-containing protein [Catenaria anguillulae PL171]|uniref:Peptidase S8/S53 domain-containing protein n=1 Tax=Catenaria anguillulae PL171 TaxID=765915 RepID=A0A1Y2HLD1_9FUNG|nr:peptidase S8/S53 domain-containing protein [Catenaria anguillulae PL171]